MSTPETQLKKVRKLEVNRTCPNCGTESPTGLGFGNICVKFQTFVCDSCKTSHQAISHRCKSVSMSSWTHDEVNALTAPYGGGNEIALKTWLANAPPIGERYSGGVRPKKGDRIEIFKQFIVDCYESKMFYAENGSQNTNQIAEPVPQATASASVRSFSAPPTSAPSANFFDFDEQPSTVAGNGFDAFAAPPQATPSSGGFDAFASTSQPSGGFDAFDTSSNPASSGFDFNSFNSTAPTASTTTSNDAFAFDSFGTSLPAPPPPPLQTSKTAPARPMGSSMNDIDPFASTSSPSRAAPPSSAPIGYSLSSGGDIFGSDVLTLQPSNSSNSNTTPSKGHVPMTGGPGPMGSGMRTGMSANPNASMAISSLGLGSPDAGMNGRHMGGRAGHQMGGGRQSNSGAFDFVGSAMQSELGRGGGTAMGGGSKPPAMGMGMNNSMGMQNGVGMNLQQNGMGMQASSMGGSGNFAISSMGMGGPPRGQPSQGGGGFPSGW
mmetsp:Transcript_20085/g.28865  ORF Transcript_20085/g.28865 Transcript_20085/m.28865 type:complete len:492 (+) Transcript_20085:101-1576(+)|eukprot:CAMPEP_0185025222 /NCGR_PEP_ID=MMETSP1103-20130426/8264_1 /TAXON_ID=36769 /ORGANISM="Paraphysomonas bandaiensis, Strain Caron Lab Isolate" /LENGTH=491 /DNA_ID=CAMNT_0027558373 /DNA_START=71 /DNA_END=1546 /DNA_ORIENTATION=+